MWKKFKKGDFVQLRKDQKGVSRRYEEWRGLKGLVTDVAELPYTRQPMCVIQFPNQKSPVLISPIMLDYWREPDPGRDVLVGEVFGLKQLLTSFHPMRVPPGDGDIALVAINRLLKVLKKEADEAKEEYQVDVSIFVKAKGEDDAYKQASKVLAATGVEYDILEESALRVEAP